MRYELFFNIIEFIYNSTIKLQLKLLTKQFER